MTTASTGTSGASARKALSWVDSLRPANATRQADSSANPTAAAQETSSESAADTITRLLVGTPRRRSSLSGTGSTGSEIEVRTASQTDVVVADVTIDLALSRHWAHRVMWVSTLASVTGSNPPAA
jgi:hypothetical protein